MPTLRPPARPAPRALGAEALIALVALYWALVLNLPLYAAARQLGAAPGVLLALAVLAFGVHFLLLAALGPRVLLKPVLAATLVAAAAGSHFMQAYGVVLDPAMLRNALRTDLAEARELWTPSLLRQLALAAGLPLLLLWRVRVAPRGWRRAAAWRAGAMTAVAGLSLAALLLAFQPLSALLREHKSLRYQLMPAALMWSGAVALGGEARAAALVVQPIGEDAARLRTAARPQVLLLVVGETARAADWGLSGYARQTTPELARREVINFASVQACGTDTETSLPCMFAPVGRRDYDEARIRGSESLLHVLARAGVGVHWRDNQSGCKGVCRGLPQDRVRDVAPPALCADGGHCLDEGLLEGLAARLDAAQGTQVIVLHMLGNHGPAYFRRYPPAFAAYQPACMQDDLAGCTPQQVRNAYDNALRYTDHVLAQAIDLLAARAGRLDGALLYVSDHGESLGEKGLFLHGMPWAIAPREQTEVPMLLWLSGGWSRSAGLDAGCLRARAAQPAAHDHLFHTVLGLLEIGTRLYEPAWDLAAPCRGALTPPAADRLARAAAGRAVLPRRAPGAARRRRRAGGRRSAARSARPRACARSRG